MPPDLENQLRQIFHLLPTHQLNPTLPVDFDQPTILVVTALSGGRKLMVCSTPLKSGRESRKLLGLLEYFLSLASLEHMAGPSSNGGNPDSKRRGHYNTNNNPP